MSGFENGVLLANNVNFNPTSPKPHLGIITQDGQLLIGSTASPNIQAGFLASGTGTLLFTTGSGTLGIDVGAMVPTLFQTPSGNAIPSSNKLIISAGSGISISGSGNTVTITNSGVTFAWNVVTSANNIVTLTKNNGYITKGAGVVDFTLPPAALVGDTFRIIGYGNLWTIAQNAGQSIRLGSSVSTSGASGSVSASMVTDCLDMICVTQNTEFFCDVIQGNPFIV